VNSQFYLEGVHLSTPFFMKIFSPAQLHAWDQYTIDHEPIPSEALMERAAFRAADWLLQHYPRPGRVMIFCGPGNNGGDGLVIARRLRQEAVVVEAWIVENARPLSADAEFHRKKLSALGAPIHYINQPTDFPVTRPGDLLVDALWGSGLNRPLEGLGAELVSYLNQSGADIISIDQPSGLMDRTTLAARARHTLSFQRWKLPFFLPENDTFTGDIHIIDIGLHPAFESQTGSRFETTGEEEAHALLRPRPRSGHKGSFGHAALLAGSWGMLGATMLAARACLRSGVGKLSCFVTGKQYDILQQAVPEAVFRIEKGMDYVSEMGFTGNYAAIGIGPGSGVHPEQFSLLEQIFRSGVPIVLDADALNLMVAYPELTLRIPAGSILTPHPREFDALTRKHTHTADRIETAMQLAMEWQSVIVLKGHHTLVATQEGRGYFNMSGNAGMATAGSGDVLTGLITGLRAQGYPALEAARLGVFLHGRAGDLAKTDIGEEALLAGDLVAYIGKAWNSIRKGSRAKPFLAE
jgi:ADP-dependent NAD(P)H-hydrate dehydratase / NAD(P)H-hydrate epimerase